MTLTVEQFIELETQRETKRAKHPNKRFTFDCLHCRTNGGRCYCEKDWDLNTNKDSIYSDVTLLQVLRGTAFQVCQDCLDFDDKDEI